MSDKKTPITVYMTAEQRVALRAIHDVTKVPEAVLIREGIDAVLLDKEEHLMQYRDGGVRS